MQESRPQRWARALLRLFAVLLLLAGTLACVFVIFAVVAFIKAPPVPETHGPSIEDVLAAASSDCEPPGQSVVLERNLLCVQGLTPTDLEVIYDAPLPGRMVQWTASDILRRGDELSAAWPTGVGFIRISQGGLRGPRVPLVSSELPDMLEERQGRLTYHYPQVLRFRGERLFLHCTPTLLPAARGIDVENCATFVPMPNHLRLTIQAYAGAFYDGGPGWPTLLRDYNPAAWQASLDEVATFLDLVVLSKEPRFEEGRPLQKP